MEQHELDVGDLMRLVHQFHDSALVHFAHASGLFELTTAPLLADELSESMGWIPRKTAIFLNSLVAVGLLRRDEQGRYRNALVVDQTLVKSRDGYLGGAVEHQRLQWNIWSQIGTALITRDVLPWHQECRFRSDPAANSAFHSAMCSFARSCLPAFLQIPIARGGGQVIDLAGGHGIYLAALAGAIPEITGEVWDLPGAESLAMETFGKFNCADRCFFVAKDIAVTSNFDGVHADVVMLNDCIWYFEPQTVRAILRAASEVLPVGGTLLIATLRLNEDEVSPAAAAGFSMYMMLNTACGGLHSTPWVTSSMLELGFSVTEWPLDPAQRHIMLVGQKCAKSGGSRQIDERDAGMIQNAVPKEFPVGFTSPV